MSRNPLLQAAAEVITALGALRLKAFFFIPGPVPINLFCTGKEDRAWR